MFQLKPIMVCKAKMARLAELIFSGTWLGIKGVPNMVPPKPQAASQNKTWFIVSAETKNMLYDPN